MLKDFVYYNPTKIYFGKNSMDNLEIELKNYGKKVLFVYGGGSIKRSGLYDKVIECLKNTNKTIYELSDVLPNPTYAKMMVGANIVKKEKINLILAVGGGSVIDCAKGIAAGAKAKNPWRSFWIKNKPTPKKLCPIGCILTMTGTGSEMNGGSVITNTDVNLKKGRVFDSNNYPKFSILNPELTYTVPEYQMLSGIFDIFSHLMEQYFSGTDDNVSDYLLEGLMKVLINNTPICIKEPTNYEARSNIMWASTMALNTITGLSKDQDWEVHSIEHQISALTNCAHGMGLASISVNYYKHIYKYGLQKFVRFAKNVFNINQENISNEQYALLGIETLDKFIKENKMHYTLQQLGCTEEMLPIIAKTCDKDSSGYKQLTTKEILKILEESY